MRITHPFHPRSGEELEVSDHQRLWGQERLLLKLDATDVTCVPVRWTSLAAPDAWSILAAGRVRLRVDDLLLLADLLDAIERARRVP